MQAIVKGLAFVGSCRFMDAYLIVKKTSKRQWAVHRPMINLSPVPARVGATSSTTSESQSRGWGFTGRSMGTTVAFGAGERPDLILFLKDHSSCSWRMQWGQGEEPRQGVQLEHHHTAICWAGGRVGRKGQQWGLKPRVLFCCVRLEMWGW